MAQNQIYIKNDRFGNPFQLKTLYQAVNKKTGQAPDGCYKGHVELGGKLYKLEISPRLKETKTGAGAVWCKVTAVKKQAQSTSM